MGRMAFAAAVVVASATGCGGGSSSIHAVSFVSACTVVSGVPRALVQVTSHEQQSEPIDVKVTFGDKYGDASQYGTGEAVTDPVASGGQTQVAVNGAAGALLSPNTALTCHVTLGKAPAV